MRPLPDYRTAAERNRAELRAAQESAPGGYLGDRLCPSTSGRDRCRYLRGHDGLHSGASGSWCGPGNPCRFARQHVDFEKHPNSWVCPHCSGGAS